MAGAREGREQARFSGGNEVRLLRGGDELFPALEQAFEAAVDSIFFETYIFWNDAAGERIADGLAAAARRGVSVTVLVDGFGSQRTIAWLRARLGDSGVVMLVFRPISQWIDWFRIRHLRRMHRKMCAVDTRIGFVGGINVMDDRFDINHGRFEQPRLDWTVQARGPIVEAIEAELKTLCVRTARRRDWKQEVQHLLKRRDRVRAFQKVMVQVLRNRTVVDVTDDGRPVRAALVLRDNVHNRRTIERSYVEAVRHASSHVRIVTPYFFPARALLKTLIGAARRGVVVDLLLQGKADYRIALWTARALYAQLARVGIRIHEYQRSFLHGKVAVVDERWATVGSSNIDPLSLLLAREANVVVLDATFARSLAASIDLAIADSIRVDPAQVAGAHWYQRLATRAAILCGRAFVALAGGGKQY
ncbi:cardiolipin synthase ClsB [soil metagenome]